ncbi:MAG: N-acetyltransferase [Planctomycetes bacterium]|nr:N-acetyltransferase [Planctomycetota bacterium]
MPEIEIEVVEHPHKHRDFIELAWQINESDTDWVPPFRMELVKLLNRKTYPFFEHGDAQFLLARRNGKPVGRIAAIDNKLYTQRYNDGRGFFGLFECEDDLEVARELFRQAALWLSERKFTSVLGPFNYSINDENPGVLVDGFNGPPLILMSYNPRYYGRLLSDIGLAKAKDMYAYMITEEVLKAERFRRVMAAIARRAPQIEQRELRQGKGFRQDVEMMLKLFNECWQGNWGFLPVSPKEVEAIVASLKQIVRPELTSIATFKGAPVAFAVCVPNLNEVLRRVRDGKLLSAPRYLGLSGTMDLVLGKSEVKGFRTMLLGVMPEYRNKGIDALMIAKIIDAGFALNQRYCELSWVLEDNEAMNSVAEKVGGSRYRTYRLFEAPLSQLMQTPRTRLIKPRFADMAHG